MRPPSLSTAISLAALLFAAPLLFGCARPAPPPEPAAKADARAEARREAVEEDVDSSDYKARAAAAGDPALEADKKREQALKDAGG